MPETRTPLPCPKSADELLEMYFLEVRCHLLEAAAGLDRIERAPGGDAALASPRGQQLQTALDILKTPGQNRAEALLNALSVQ